MLSLRLFDSHDPILDFLQVGRRWLTLSGNGHSQRCTCCRPRSDTFGKIPFPLLRTGPFSFNDNVPWTKIKDKSSLTSKQSWLLSVLSKFYQSYVSYTNLKDKRGGHILKEREHEWSEKRNRETSYARSYHGNVYSAMCHWTKQTGFATRDRYRTTRCHPKVSDSIF